ncbi:tetrapyrrole (Corrin/Porphyrin) Methylase [Actinidia rufa]|uniref:Tetrapyrrole (Corrin/Porphyrin) Methylase n=1 Tax=Actinidia rufa TaxID=165716 RepID=A0A7J0GHS2_9ERIC|nr:tetrapyrrole (Corrin/Porphyrin) Methylase [Actinidia rufa]
MLVRRFHSSMAVSLSVSLSAALPWRSTRPRRVFVTTTTTTITPLTSVSLSSPLCPRRSIALSFCSNSDESTDLIPQPSSKQCPLKPGLYLVGTPIGNLEDITLRALRVLRSADVILSEDTRHSGKLLQHYNIKTPLLSYHKFNESQREQGVLNRLRQGEIVAQISDAGTPGISDPAELSVLWEKVRFHVDLFVHIILESSLAMINASLLTVVKGLKGTQILVKNNSVKLCVKENLPVIPIPGPSAFVAALSASGLATEEFTFVGFLPKHAGSRRERMIVSANEVATQIFFVPPHKLHQFVEEASSIFGDCR